MLTSLLLASSLSCVALPPGDGDDVPRLCAEAASLRDAIEGMRRAVGAVRLVVNGEGIPEVAVERSFVYVLGQRYLEQKIRDFLVADEIALRKRAGRSTEEVRVDPADVLKEIESIKDQVATQAPGFSFEAVLRSQSLNPSSLFEEQASWLIFDRVFLPDDPAQWPETTVQAIVSAGGQPFLDQMKEGYAKGRAEKPNEALPPFYRQIMRQWIVKAVRQVTRVLTPLDGIPPEIALKVNEWELPTAEAYRAVAPMVTAHEREKVLRWLAWSTAVRQALVRANVYLPDEEFRKEFEAHEGPYKASPLNIETVALAFKKFPSYDAYKEYYRLRKSFERMIEKEITDAALAKHAERMRDFLGDGKVDAQVILKSAMDYSDFSWKGPDAFDQAMARTKEVVARLKKGESFDSLIDRESEFFDAPVNPAQAPQAARPNRGRFGPQGKNNLKGLLGETEFDELLRGYSIGEILFHDVAVGETIGPIRGPLGCYVARVTGRTPGNRPLDLAQESTRQLVREDLVVRRFLEWSNDVVGASKIEIR